MTLQEFKKEFPKRIKFMITKQEYLKALDVVLAYHEQVKVASEPFAKTKLRDWVNENTEEMSIRLRNILDCPVYYVGEDVCMYEYLEDLTKHKFLKLRNAGLKAWAEFERIRGTH